MATRIGVVLLLALVLACLGMFFALNADSSVFTPLLFGLYLLGALSILGALATLMGAALRCARGPGSWLVRTGESVLALTALYGLWLIFRLGLASFNLHY